MKKVVATLEDVRFVRKAPEYLVLDKPSPIPTTRRNPEETYLGEKLAQEGEIDEPSRPVVPVDDGASGLVIYARTAAAAKSLGEIVAAGALEVESAVLVSGFVSDDGVVERPIHVDRRRGKVTLRDSGDPAVTRYRIERRVAGHTLLTCMVTTHVEQQIRLHLASIGVPLAIDPEHGGGKSIWLSHFKPGYRPSRKHEERPLLARLSMHITRVRFPGPDGSMVECESPWPKEFRATVNQLERVAQRSDARAY